MRTTLHNLRNIIREALQQYPMGRLNPHAGHMTNQETSGPYSGYILWSRTNGHNPASPNAVASYALEMGLAEDSLEIREISQKLGLGADTLRTIRKNMMQNR